MGLGATVAVRMDFATQVLLGTLPRACSPSVPHCTLAAFWGQASLLLGKLSSEAAACPADPATSGT